MLEGFLYDGITANIDGVESTGNCARWPPHGAALQKNSHLDLILLPLISQHIYCPPVGIIYFNPISFSFLNSFSRLFTYNIRQCYRYFMINCILLLFLLIFQTICCLRLELVPPFSPLFVLLFLGLLLLLLHQLLQLLDESFEVIILLL